MAAPAVFLRVGAPTTLYSSQCVTMTMDHGSVRIVAHGGSDEAASCAIDGIMSSTEMLLERGEPFRVTWDLRSGPVPGPISTARLIAWGLKRKAELDRLTIKMGVLIPGGPLTGVVKSVVQSAVGSTPTLVSNDVTEVEAFVRS